MQMAGHVYSGKRFEGASRFVVRKDGKVLDARPSQRVVNHSPDGFAWGYGGSGPAQLALALLLDACDERTALRFYQRFKWDVVAVWPIDGSWELTEDQLKHWVSMRRTADRAEDERSRPGWLACHRPR
jgi:hypothetical protein